MIGRLRLRRRQRIRSRGDFRRILQRRCTVSDRCLLIYVDWSVSGAPRIGVRAGKRLGNAVVRAREKRCLREAFRLRQHDVPPLDYVCIPRCPGCSTDRYARSLEVLAGEAARKLARQSCR